LDPLALFSLHATSLWSIFLAVSHHPLAHNRLAESSDAPSPASVRALETGQRAAFLSMLVAEIAGTRRMIKAYQADTEALERRLNTALTQSLVLRASLEIMEKRVALLKARSAHHDVAETSAGNSAAPGC
jgi:hypothetical protein